MRNSLLYEPPLLWDKKVLTSEETFDLKILQNHSHKYKDGSSTPDISTDSSRPPCNLFRRFLPSVLSLGKTDGTSAPRRHLMASEGGIDGRGRVVSKCRQPLREIFEEVIES